MKLTKDSRLEKPANEPKMDNFQSSPPIKEKTKEGEEPKSGAEKLVNSRKGKDKKSATVQKQSEKKEEVADEAK